MKINFLVNILVNPTKMIHLLPIEMKIKILIRIRCLKNKQRKKDKNGLIKKENKSSNYQNRKEKNS